MNQINLVKLTAEDILSLILEKTVQRENLCIASSSSFLAVLSLLELEMTKKLQDVKFS